MGEREDLVYQAKLAEQAERYDGKTHALLRGPALMAAAGIFFSLFFFVRRRSSSSARDTPAARVRLGELTCVLTAVVFQLTMAVGPVLKIN